MHECHLPPVVQSQIGSTAIRTKKSNGIHGVAASTDFAGKVTQEVLTDHDGSGQVSRLVLHLDGNEASPWLLTVEVSDPLSEMVAYISRRVPLNLFPNRLNVTEMDKRLVIRHVTRVRTDGLARPRIPTDPSPVFVRDLPLRGGITQEKQSGNGVGIRRELVDLA